MKRTLTIVGSGLIAGTLWGGFATGAAAQSTDPDPKATNVFWSMVQAQDPYFNKSGSVMGQRYTRTDTRPVPSSSARPAPWDYGQANQVYPNTAYQVAESTSDEYRQTNTDALWGYISELRFGVMGHDVRFPSRHEFHMPNPFENRYEGGVNLNPEVIFTSPDWLDWAYAPRPRVGISINTSGDTNSAYTSLGWDTAWDNGIYLDGFFGLAVHDGELTDGNDKGKIEFGSTVLFHLGGDLGWRWDDHNGIALVWEHMSNGSILASKNQGIDSLGLRYSYRFDSPQ